MVAGKGDGAAVVGDGVAAEAEAYTVLSTGAAGTEVKTADKGACVRGTAASGATVAVTRARVCSTGASAVGAAEVTAVVGTVV